MGHNLLFHWVVSSSKWSFSSCTRWMISMNINQLRKGIWRKKARAVYEYLLKSFFFFENKIFKLLYRPICISTKDGAREIPFCLLLEFDFDGYKSFLSCQSCHALLFTIFWSLSMQSSIVIIWKTFKSNVKQLLTKGMISTCALNCGVSHTYIMWSSKPKSNYNINVWV